MANYKDMEGRPVRDTDRLVPHANRLLAGVAKGVWRGFKFLAGVAIRIPGWFLRANRRHLSVRNGGPVVRDGSKVNGPTSSGSSS